MTRLVPFPLHWPSGRSRVICIRGLRGDMYPVSHIFRSIRIYRAVHFYLVLNELFKKALGDRCTIRCPRPVRRHYGYSNSSFLQRKLSNKDILPERLRGDRSHVTAIKVTVPYNSYRQLPAPPILPLQWFSVSPRGYAQDNNERWTDNIDNTDFLAPVEIIRSRSHNHNHTVIW